MIGLTTQEVARRLEVSESTVKKYDRDGLLERVGRREGRIGRPIIFSESSVIGLERARRIGKYGRLTRRVLVHADVHEDIPIALEAAGLHCCVAATLLGVVAEHEGDGMPIIVVPEEIGAELGLLDAIITKVYCIVIGDDAPNERVRRRCTVVYPDELRWLVQVSWKLVDQRIRQNTLKL